MSSDHALAVDALPGMSFDNVTLTLSGTPSFTLSNTWNYTVNVSGAVSTGSYTLRSCATRTATALATSTTLTTTAINLPTMPIHAPLSGEPAGTVKGAQTTTATGCRTSAMNSHAMPRSNSMPTKTAKDNALGTRGDDCPTTYGEQGTTLPWTPTTTVGTTSGCIPIPVQPVERFRRRRVWGRILRIPRRCCPSTLEIRPLTPRLCGRRRRRPFQRR